MGIRGLTAIVLTVLAWLAGPAAATAQPGTAAPTDEALRRVETAPVVVDGHVLLRVRGTSSFSAEERARGIASRIVAAARDPKVTAASVAVVSADGTVRITAADHALITVFAADAALEEVDLQALAFAHRERVRQTLVDYRRARTPQALRRSAVAAAGATVALAIAIFVILRVTRLVQRLLTRRVERRIRPLEFQSYEIVRAEHIANALRGAPSVLSGLSIVAAVVAYLTLALSLFPWTRGVSSGMSGALAATFEALWSSALAEIPNLIVVTVIVIVSRFVLRLVRLFFEAVEKGAVTMSGFDPEWAPSTSALLRIGIIAVAVVVAYPYIPGSESAAFKGVSLFLGVLVSLGSTSLIANLLAGYMLTYRRAFKIGDCVRIGDAFGEVAGRGRQATYVDSFKHERLVIPNSTILTSTVVNYTALAQSRGLILHTEVGIGYETSWRQVEEMLLTAAGRTEGLLEEPRPFVLQTRLGDFAVTHQLNVACGDARRMPALYAELHRHILDVFNENGVQIMTPAYESDPAEPKVVRQEGLPLPPSPVPTAGGGTS
jgi:small-conductance mechanosensitive channel